MKKTFILTVFFLFFTASVFASLSKKIDLEALHGKTLKKTSFVMRYQFKKESGVDWQRSSYAQRKAFLEQWYVKAAEEKKRDAEREKEEVRRLKQKREDKLREARKEKGVLKADAAQAKAEAEDHRSMVKSFDETVRARDRKIRELKSLDQTEK